MPQKKTSSYKTSAQKLKGLLNCQNYFTNFLISLTSSSLKNGRPSYFNNLFLTSIPVSWQIKSPNWPVLLFSTNRTCLALNNQNYQLINTIYNGSRNIPICCQKNVHLISTQSYYQNGSFHSSFKQTYLIHHQHNKIEGWEKYAEN